MQLKSNAPEIKWIINHAASHDFARSLDQQLLKKGALSDNQLAAVRRIIEAPAQAVAVSIERIEQAFDTARESGLKKLKLRLGAFEFKPAKEGSRNAGAIYVTEAGQYLGKVVGGKFHGTRECLDAQKEAIIEVCADPAKAAAAYGKETGCCACCGRELTDPESIARSIGPVCAERYGF
jgi:hypothetical protein